MHGDIRATEGLALKRHMQAARSISIMRTSPCFRMFSTSYSVGNHWSLFRANWKPCEKKYFPPPLTGDKEWMIVIFMDPFILKVRLLLSSISAAHWCPVFAPPREEWVLSAGSYSRTEGGNRAWVFPLKLKIWRGSNCVTETQQES